MSELPEQYKTCGRCVHDGEGDPNIPESVCYMCKRNYDDHRIDRFEEKKEEVPGHTTMKLEGRILLFDQVNKNRDVFPKACKIVIPEKVPLCWEFDHNLVIGIAEVTRDDKGLIAKAETFSNDFIGIRDLRDNFTDNKIGVGGFYNNVKKHSENHLIVVDEATLLEVSLTLMPVNSEYIFRIVKEEDVNTKTYQIELEGCDNTTGFEMELTDEEYELLKRDCCMPRMYVKEVKENKND